MGSPPKPFPETDKLHKTQMSIREEWKSRIDNYGLITQHKHLEGADTCQRVNMMRLAVDILRSIGRLPTSGDYPYTDDKEYHRALNWLEHERYKGLWRRHPNFRHWYGRFKGHETRDQKRMLVAALGSSKSLKRLWQTFWRHLSRRGLLFAEGNRKNHQYADRAEAKATNPKGVWNGDKWRWPDPTGPQFWASYVRGFINCFGRTWISVVDGIFTSTMACEIMGWTDFLPDDLNWLIFLSPMVWLTILDIHTLISSIQAVVKGKAADNPNHIGDLAWGTYCHPTLTMELARFVYMFRPIAPALRAGYVWERKFGPQTTLDYYFRPENGGGPMHKVWKPVIDWLYPQDHWFWGTIRKKLEKVR